MRRAFIGRVAILAFFLLTVVPPSFSQATALAQLNGTIRDQTGAVVPRATISLRNKDTNQTQTSSSGNEGYYTFANVPPGSYELSVEAPGFSKTTRDIPLSVGQIATSDVSLTVATAEKEVVVNAEAGAVIEPTRTEVSQVVGLQQIQELPISGRLFTDFALLSPGVATGRISLQSTFTDPSTTRISFGGQRDLDNEVTVDGADDINSATGSQRATPAQEAVSEFRVVNNSFESQYGRALGGIVNIVTKSGTNEVHGSVYEYFQNDALDARSLLQPAPLADTLRQNQFGATLGGPIRKNKTFYFVNYEGQRRSQAPTYPQVLFAPTASQFTPLGLPNPFPGATVLQAINTVKGSLGLAPEDLTILKTANVDNGFVKVDHQLNEKNRLSARYSIQGATDLNMLVGETLDGGGIGMPSSGRNGLLRDQALVGTWTSQLQPNIVNTALVQWARRNYGFPGVTGQPNLDVPNLLLFGHNFGAFDRYNETRLQFSDTVSWVKNKHFAQFGFDSNYIKNFVVWPGFTPSRDIFPSLSDLLVSSSSNWGSTPCPPPLVGLTAPCIAAFFWGAPIGSGPFNPNAPSPPVPTTWQNAYLPSEASNFNVFLNHSYYGFFAQDQWRIAPKLTLNYGLRYDFETGLGFYIDPDYREVQPRVGIAYSPDPKTVIRAGYGIFFDRYNLTFFFVPGPQRPPVIPGLPTNNNDTTGTWLLNSLFLPTPCFLSGCPQPGSAVCVTRGCSNNGGPPLPAGTAPPPLVDAAFENLITSGSFPANSLFAQGGTLAERNLRAPYSEQASFEIQHQFTTGLSASIGYLFVAGHKLVRPLDLNVGPAVGTETGTGKLIYDYAIPWPGAAPLPWGPFGTNGIFYITDSSGNSSYNGLLLQAQERIGRYFSLNANYTFSKTLDNGTFVTFVSTPQSFQQRDLERALSNQDVRNRFVANFILDAPSRGPWRNFKFSSIITVQSPRPFTEFVGFDANNDGNPVTDRVGESARNVYEGDNLRSWDLRLSRIVHLAGERYRLQLIFDTFNILNRPDFCGGAVPQHYNDAASLGIQSFSVGNCPAGGPPVPNNLFGTPRTMFNPRQFQLAVKLLF
ncbi:MAG: hypothetical protein DMG30_05960 [Acidobacteria bacterium]|nr:MAG: hypothetical protein DMG30_05960 [Acidobacteriota bacterium]